MGKVIRICPRGLSHTNPGSPGKIVQLFPRANERNRAANSRAKMATTRTEKFAEMELQRESMIDRSREAIDYFEHQSSIWNNQQATSVAQRVARQGKDWT